MVTQNKYVTVLITLLVSAYGKGSLIWSKVGLSSVAMLRSVGRADGAATGEAKRERSLTERKDKTEARGGHTESPPRHHPGQGNRTLLWGARVPCNSTIGVRRPA